MAKGGVKTNKQYDQHDDKLKAKDFDTSFGSLDPSSTDDGAGPTGNMTVGTGIPATNFNIFTNHDDNIELALKLHNRSGPDIIPVSYDADGTANYDAPAGHTGTGTGERALWNFDFAVNTGIEGSSQTLDAFDFRIVIESGDGERAVFNMQHVAPGITPWVNEANGGVINDDDGFGSGNLPGGSPQISQNSVNLGFGFMQAVFGSDYNDAGESYHIELQAFDNLRLIGNVAIDIDI